MIVSTSQYPNLDFPRLVLCENQDGSVQGVVMRASNPGERLVARLADRAAEPTEVAVLIGELRDLNPDDRWNEWRKDFNIDAESLDAAIAASPRSSSDQIGILLYRNSQWLDGLWTAPGKRYSDGDNPCFLSVADFYGIRASQATRDARAGIETVLANKVLSGDFDLLRKACDLVSSQPMPEKGAYESHPAIQAVCAWWNANAPENMQRAAYFRTYLWDAQNRVFLACDPEEPASGADVVATVPCYAVFFREGLPLTVLEFYRGRENNVANEWGVKTIYANGDEAYEIGADLEDVDEAFYTLRGLRHLNHLFSEVPAS